MANLKMYFLRNICRLHKLASMTWRTRGIHFSSRLNTSYDSDGKMTVTVLNQDTARIMVDSYSLDGFRLNNGVFIVGPVVLFQNTVLCWNVQEDHDINEKSLSLFTILEPKLDILIIGCGKTGPHISQIDRNLLPVRQRYKINIEVMPTEKAAATFNFLTAEERYVAAALIPPVHVQLHDDDIVKAKSQKTGLHKE